MPMTTSQFLTLCEGNLISKVHHEPGTRREPQHSQVFKVGTLDELYIEEAKMAGFGLLQLMAEGASVTYDEAIAPITKRWDYDTYGLAYAITRKLQINDRFGDIAKLEGDLDVSVDDTVETFAFGILNNITGTSSAYMTGFDGLALASTAHTRLDGGATQSNYANTALSYTALQDAKVAMRKVKNDRGRPVRQDPNKLFIHADLMHTADEILRSSGNPGNANNVVNTVNGYVEPVVLDYVTSSTFAMLQAPTHDLRLVWRTKPTKSMDEDFNTGNILRKVVMDILRGHGEWRGVHVINE